MKIINSDSNFNDFYESFLSEQINQDTSLINNLHNNKNYSLITNEFRDLLIPSMEERIMLADMIAYLADDILVKIDRSSMAFGLETRVPFLDHRLVRRHGVLIFLIK